MHFVLCVCFILVFVAFPFFLFVLFRSSYEVVNILRTHLLFVAFCALLSRGARTVLRVFLIVFGETCFRTATTC